MEKHITLVGILNIVYRSLLVALAGILLVAGTWFGRWMEYFFWRSHVHYGEDGAAFFSVLPFIIGVFGAVILLVSIAGIIGSIGVLQRRRWGRIVLLVVSFLNLLHFPIGTALGAYSIWVLMNDETVELFEGAPAAGPQRAMPRAATPA